MLLTNIILLSNCYVKDVNSQMLKREVTRLTTSHQYSDKLFAMHIVCTCVYRNRILNQKNTKITISL